MSRQLIKAAQSVVDNWGNGNLAFAVQELEQALQGELRDKPTDMFGNDLTKTDSFGTVRETVQHSPLPWSVANNWIMKRNVTCDVRIAVCDAYTAPKAVSDPRDKANAAFIVRAVNSHERLVQVIRDELEAIRVWQSARGVPTELRDGFDISISKLRTALAEVGS